MVCYFGMALGYEHISFPTGHRRHSHKDYLGKLVLGNKCNSSITVCHKYLNFFNPTKN